ncbi:hypothetical protein F5Y07DRAFT_397515 [Xylaria sp. FL0933]|nr:hypothetical protein F5Y07DRAFT_397515 [Xylaria sp. FL0933]
MSRSESYREAMTPDLSLQTAPLDSQSGNSTSWKSHTPHSYVVTLIPNRHRDDASELQRKLNIIIRRVTGIFPRSAISSYSSSSSNSSRSLPPSDEDADDDTSDYGEEDEEDENEEYQISHPVRPMTSSSSSTSTQDSYTSLASLNPYSINTEDLPFLSTGEGLETKAEGEGEAEAEAKVEVEGGIEVEGREVEAEMREDRHKRDSALLAQQLDSAHAAVVEEEGAALRALRRQTRLY